MITDKCVSFTAKSVPSGKVYVGSDTRTEWVEMELPYVTSELCTTVIPNQKNKLVFITFCVFVYRLCSLPAAVHGETRPL